MKSLFQKQSAELQTVLDPKNLESFHEQISLVVTHLKDIFDKGKKVLIAGNGGSAAEAQHFSDEMVGRYKGDRRAYPAIALSADGAVITCIGNDYGYDNVFRRQVAALGQEGDVFIGLSTSGNSKNILAACEEAKDRGLTLVALTGPVGKLKDIVDYAIVSPSTTPARMQELHLHAIHLMCEAFEE